ncbi:MAG: type II toxin-antitoxin system Phd/YefM family antitoxin [Chloroflexi bacterium]|nr:type II toxin-antitoxin system Phd/YefM family antitoxin [Chloroflexota bacterium]
MRSVGIRELREKLSQIVREVSQRRETVQITQHGRVVAQITPAPLLPSEEEWREYWKKMDSLAAEIDRYWPAGVSAAQSIAEDRE